MQIGREPHTPCSFYISLAWLSMACSMGRGSMPVYRLVAAKQRILILVLSFIAIRYILHT